MDGHDDEAVGYGRPPRGKRFEKGKSGNPRGRPRKVRGEETVAGALARALDEKITVSKNGRRQRITKGSAMAQRLVNDAVRGDKPATKLTFDTVAKMPAALRAPGPPPLTETDQEIMQRLIVRMRDGYVKVRPK